MPKLGPDSKEYSFCLNCISRIKTSSQVGMKLLLKSLANLARLSCGLLRNSGQLVRNFCAGPKRNVSQLGTYSYVFSLGQANPFLKNARPWVLARPVLMTACVPVLLLTTLPQRVVPATLPLGPVPCRILGGRTVFSCQGAACSEFCPSPITGVRIWFLKGFWEIYFLHLLYKFGYLDS